MIRIRGLSKEYLEGARALDDVGLDVADGEFVADRAERAGKSSLLRGANGLTAPTAGLVEVEGAAVTSESGPALRRIRARLA